MNNNKQTSSAGVTLIKSFEGCVLKAYKDIVGVWTNGYGNTKNVTPDTTITQAQADSDLAANLKTYEDAVNQLVTVAINQCQFDALVSFAFNLGVGSLKKSTLLKLVNEGKFDEAAAQFEKWDMAGGKHVAGLTRRRQAEAALFSRV